MLYPLSYEGGAWSETGWKPRGERRGSSAQSKALPGRPTGTGYWTRAMPCHAPSRAVAPCHEHHATPVRRRRAVLSRSPRVHSDRCKPLSDLLVPIRGIGERGPVRPELHADSRPDRAAAHRGRHLQREGQTHEAVADGQWRHEPEHSRSAGRVAGETDRGVERPVHSHGDVRPSHGGSRHQGLAVHQRDIREPHGGAGLEVRRRAGAHRAAQHRREVLGAARRGGGRPAGGRRGRPLPRPLDAAVRVDGADPVIGRDGVGGAERREHGDDP